MESGLFRQKSIERISSPEDLHDYMRVTSPRLWMLLIAIALLLTGFIIYAATATLENTLDITVNATNMESFRSVDDGEPEPYEVTLFSAILSANYKDSVDTNMVVRVGNNTGKIDFVALTKNVDNDDEEELMLMIEMDDPNLRLADGDYMAELVLESTTPLSFLWN